MDKTNKLLILILGSVFIAVGCSAVSLTKALSRSVKEDLVSESSGVDYTKLGPLGPGALSLMSSQLFGHLGLSPQQSLGVMSALAGSGLFYPSPARPTPQQFLATTPPPSIDPYFLQLLAHYAKYLPYGLGAQGFFGSTGLPKNKPPGIFNYNQKD